VLLRLLVPVGFSYGEYEDVSNLDKKSESYLMKPATALTYEVNAAGRPIALSLAAGE
jgi:hypothetical protein